MNIQYTHLVKEEVVKIDPVLAVWVARQVDVTRGGQVWLRDSVNRSY